MEVNVTEAVSLDIGEGGTAYIVYQIEGESGSMFGTLDLVSGQIMARGMLTEDAQLRAFALVAPMAPAEFTVYLPMVIRSGEE